MPTTAIGVYDTGRTAGEECTSTGEGRHVSALESELTHPTHTDGLVNVNDPVMVGENIVGVAFKSAAAATDLIVIDTEGLWYLSVVATNDRGNVAVVAGDELFINKTTCIISKDFNKNTHAHFGYALGGVVSGETAVIPVKVHWDPDDAEELVGNSNAYYTGTILTGMNFREYRYASPATSGDTRGIYNRLKLTGVGGSGESLRSFTTVEDVRGVNAHGAHISLNWGDTGSISGLGAAVRATLHIADQDYTALPGSYYAMLAELYADGAVTDPVGMTQLGILCLSLSGDATGIADLDDDAYAIVIAGATIGGGNMIQTDVDETKFSHKVKCYMGGQVMYIMCCAT